MTGGSTRPGPRPRARRETPWIVGGALILGVLIIFLIVAPPSVQLWLARETGVARLQLRSVHAAPGGLVVNELFSLSRGGQVGKISFVPANGEVRSTLMSRGYDVLGVTDELIWTSAPGRPSFSIPTLEEGPRQAEVLARCGVDAFEVTIPEGSGRLRVTTRAGETLYCSVHGERSPRHSGAAPPASSSGFALVRRGVSSDLVRAGAVVAAGLLDADIPETVPARGGLGDAGFLYVVHRRQLGAAVPLVLSRFGAAGEEWSSVLQQEACTIVDSPRMALVEGRILVVGMGRNCSGAMALDPRSGRVLWGRVLSSTWNRGR